MNTNTVYRRKNIEQDLSLDSETVCKKLTLIWSKLLASVGFSTKDNFFDCGGNSLLLTYLQWHIEKTFSLNLPLIELFKHPTISSLTQIILEYSRKE